MKKNSNVLITGATGYIGSNLARRLIEDGFLVHILYRNTSSLDYLSDIKDKLNFHFYDESIESIIKAISDSQPEYIFHLASLFLATHKAGDIKSLIDSNILLGTQLLESIDSRKEVRFVNVSTSWIHYKKSEYDPVCLYAATKKAFEDILVFFVNTKKINAITLELCDSYGPRDNRKKLFNLLNAQESGSTLKMSPGEQLLDIVYITDIIDAFYHCCDLFDNNKGSKHARYSISSGKTIKLKDLVEMYLFISKKDIEIDWGGNPYRNREVMDPITSTPSLPGWKPKYPLASGLSNVWDAYRLNDNKGT